MQRLYKPIASLLALCLAASASAQDTQRYAAHQSVAVQVKNPNPMATSRWTTVRTSAWGFVDTVEMDGGLTYVERTCDVSTSRVFGTTTSYSPAFIASLVSRSRTGRIVGDQLTAGPYVQVIGADPNASVLTADTALDTDGDGLPGVTISVRQAVMGQGDVYVAQRSTSSFTMVRVGDGWSGTISNVVEEVVLDATTWWLKADRTSRPHPDSSESTVSWVPVGATTTCAEVLQQRDQLFETVASR
ncbi:MAG: hypothetical protein ACJATT_001518 [Myxococcota bacterium]|jgi:hypothetical protein